MSDEPGSAVAVTTVEWRLYNPRRKESRTYEQAELTIEGEARLVGLARKVGAVLADAGYTFGQLGEFFDDTRTDPETGEPVGVDWPKALTLIEHVAQYAPDLIGDAMTVFFGIFPTNEDGSPNPDFDDHRLFLRGAVNIAKVTDVTRVFLAQNEYSRLIGPFSATLSEAMDAYAAPGASASSEVSGPQAIVGGDGSTVLLEPETSSDTTTTEPSTSETETPSEPSPDS